MMGRVRPAACAVVLALAGTLASVPATQAATPHDALGDCGSRAACLHSVLALLNGDRAAAGVPALRLKRMQSNGSRSCVGSYGHSLAMASSGGIWHSSARYPRASFPHNICVRYTAAGENVGEATTGSTLTDLRTLDHLMMSEPHSASLCAQEDNHACNILDGAFHHVGIGVYSSAGTTWLTEDFTS